MAYSMQDAGRERVRSCESEGEKKERRACQQYQKNVGNNAMSVSCGSKS